MADDPIAPEAAVLQLQLDSCRQGIGNRATAVSLGNGVAVTAAHSFLEIDGFRVISPSGVESEGSLVAIDVDRDVAVVSFDDRAMDPGVRDGLGLADDADGDTTVTVVLYPTDGVVTQAAEILRRAQVTLDGVGRRDGIELATRIEPGDSGAPVMSDDGEVIGIVFASSRGSNQGWAVAATELRRTLGQVGDPIPLACS